MKTRSRQSPTIRKIKYGIYIVTAIAGAGLMFYFNVKRENTLRTIQERRLLIQEQFDSDPRFKGLTFGIDRNMQVSTVTGNVASEQDAKDLRQMVFKLRPFTGTYNWRIDVEVKGGRQP